MNAHNPIDQHSKDSGLLSASFNQDQTCFAVSCETGFRVYNTDPMELRVRRSFNTVEDTKLTGIGLVKMLHRTNYLALVGGGKNPKFPINKVIIWDDLKKKPSLSIEFMSPVLNVLVSRIRIVVILQNKVLVHGFNSPPKLLSSFETVDNTNGTADLSSGATSGISLSSVGRSLQILAFPGRALGQIQLVDVSPEGQERNLVSIIKAHKGRIRSLAINASGTLVASASQTGTIIRVHSTANCALLYEFRRGLDKAVITSMKFSPNGSKLAVLSDKNSLHVFDIHNAESNREHFLKKVPLLKPNYFNSTWSFVSTHIDENRVLDKLENVDSRLNDEGVVGWAEEDSIVVVWKKRAKWEKYVIVEGEIMDGKKKWKLIREGWRSLIDVDD